MNQLLNLILQNWSDINYTVYENEIKRKQLRLTEILKLPIYDLYNKKKKFGNLKCCDLISGWHAEYF